ncbi:MAG: LytTR family transcriptional regulator [Bacteroidales bacterium]|jgi:hypothetical protein|nr:LytTR family transcriptional regulator [Bacteroidales bacterium]
MKRLLVISYWIVSILLVAILLSSLGYRFVEALFIGTMFLPGALAAKYFFPKVEFKNRRAGVKNTIYIVLGILVAEMLLFLLAHYYIMMYRKNVSEWIAFPEILTNPVFIVLVLTVLATGSYFFESWLDRKRPTPPAPVTFTSFRKPVTLQREEILYVESNDDATTVVATDGRRFKNITPISQWEATLKPQFIRIHRSYLVNKSAVTGVDVDLLNIGDIQLPISRKYKDQVTELFS